MSIYQYISISVYIHTHINSTDLMLPQQPQQALHHPPRVLPAGAVDLQRSGCAVLRRRQEPEGLECVVDVVLGVLDVGGVCGEWGGACGVWGVCGVWGRVGGGCRMGGGVGSGVCGVCGRVGVHHHLQQR